MYTQLSPNEREQIGLLRAAWVPVPTIASIMKRHQSTIRRELKRFGPRTRYSPLIAQADAKKKRRIPRTPRKLDTDILWSLVQAKLRLRWSPEQIAHHLKKTYADSAMHVSHETIYTYMYILPRGELRKELISYLRQGARGRQRRKRDTDNRGKIGNIVSIHERPSGTKRRTELRWREAEGGKIIMMLLPALLILRRDPVRLR